MKALTPKHKKEEIISFENGILSSEVLEAIFNTLPVEITFVDKNDIVQYFNQPKERIFDRPKTAIGRTVQQCHSEKTIPAVNQLIEDLKTDKKDVVEFWTSSKDRLIHIRYFSVRNKNGEYLGCLELAQDITEIKRIEGEKSLL